MKWVDSMKIEKAQILAKTLTVKESKFNVKLFRYFCHLFLRFIQGPAGSQSTYDEVKENQKMGEQVDISWLKNIMIQ